MRVVSLHFGGPICLAGGRNNSFFKCPTKNTAADALYTGDWHHFIRISIGQSLVYSLSDSKLCRSMHCEQNHFQKLQFLIHKK